MRIILLNFGQFCGYQTGERKINELRSYDFEEENRDAKEALRIAAKAELPELEVRAINVEGSEAQLREEIKKMTEASETAEPPPAQARAAERGDVQEKFPSKRKPIPEIGERGTLVATEDLANENDGEETDTARVIRIYDLV